MLSASAPNIPYDFDLNIDYKTIPDSTKQNRIYRKYIRELFFMNVEMTPEIACLDHETQDELLYDETTMNSTLQLLFDATCNNPLFQNLYDLGAEAFFSCDRTIGQAVLFSYDYLPLFHPCLKTYFREPDNWVITNPHYLALKKRLT